MRYLTRDILSKMLLEEFFNKTKFGFLEKLSKQKWYTKTLSKTNKTFKNLFGFDHQAIEYIHITFEHIQSHKWNRHSLNIRFVCCVCESSMNQSIVYYEVSMINSIKSYKISTKSMIESFSFGFHFSYFLINTTQFLNSDATKFFIFLWGICLLLWHHTFWIYFTPHFPSQTSFQSKAFLALSF